MSTMGATIISILVVYGCLQMGAGDGKYKRGAEMKDGDKDIAFPDDLGIVHHHHHHHPEFHHHHHHSPDFHHHHGGFEEEEGPGEDVDLEPELDYNNRSRQIPLAYIQNLNDFNVTDLLLNFVEGDDEVGSIKNRFGEDDVQERSAASMAKGADCLPELRTVKLASSEDPSILYIPQCTRIEQCGGCCKHDLLSCQPLKSDSVPFKVYKTQYTGDKKLKFLGIETIMVEKHTKCKCQCRIKPQDCTKFQEYRESECGCACVNFDEKKKCLRQNDTKLWNPDLCTCQCRESRECSTGSYFDSNHCKCVASPINRRMASFQRRSYRSEIVPIVPLDEN